MPQRLLLAWGILGGHNPAESFGMTFAAGVAALGALAMNADAWGAGIAAISVGLAYALIRMTPAVAGLITTVAPAVADAIRQIGGAWVEVRHKLRDDVAETRAISQQNQKAIVEVKAEATAKAVEVAAMVDEVEAKATERRHDLADRIQAQLLKSQIRITELEAKIAAMTPPAPGGGPCP